MLQPNTDAEMYAWNYGVEWSIAYGALGGDAGTYAGAAWPTPFGDAERAQRTLGADLFRTWAERGYAAARATT